MYTIYADGVCIYNDVFAVDDMKVIDPKLTLEDCVAGSLSMTLPPTNKGYNTIVRLKTDISVEKDGQEIWAGRVLSEGKDFWNNRTLLCEGELAFFNDSSQPPHQYSGLTVRAYMEELIAVHNSKVSANRQFSIGAVTVYDENFPVRYTNYEKTIELFNALIEQYGGHLRVRKENGVRYLDYLADYPDTCSQLIQFGSNLIDFTRDWDCAEFATAIVPLGSRLKESPIEALDAYTTVESVNDGRMYVQSDEAVAAYGWIEKVVTWDNISDPALLLEVAKAYLADIQFDNLTIELSALDLHYMDVNYEAVKLLDLIRVVSRPHGLDRLFPVTKLDIPLDSPEKTQFTLGSTIRVSLTEVNNQTNTAILNKIENLPKAHNVLKEAKENATQIMNMATTGYITITKDAYGSDTLYITNTRDYTAASKMWKWNMNGLGYSNDGGKTFGLAITMDGAIVADYITAGTLSGNRIRTGIIRSENDNLVFNLDEGSLTMKKGMIEIGNDFKLNENGVYIGGRGTFAGTLSAAKGTFGGQLTAATGNFKGVVQASDFLDRYGNSMTDLANKKFTAEYLDLYGITITNKYTRALTFKVDGSSGEVTINGKIIMGTGSSINWAQVSNQNLSSNPAYSLADSAWDYADSAWNHADTANDNADEAYSYAIDAYRERCTDQNVFNVLTGGGTQYGVFSSESGRLYINANYIRAGTIDASIVSLSGNYGGFCQGYGSDGVRRTYGAMMYGSNGEGVEPYIMVTNAGARMSGSDADFWVANNIYASEAITVGSDRRIKNSISFNLDQYDKFFMALKPARFKYNQGASGRLHLGFIAQEVEEALLDAGLTTRDLAALVKTPVQEVTNPKITDFNYSLRYGEFIALNTHMIQKLYRLVNELLQKGEST